MNANEFIKRLEEIPSRLEKLGLSQVDVQSLISNYTIKPKKTLVNYDSPILDLVSNYMVSRLEIGMINFDEEISETEDFIFFGKVEQDDLAISKNLGGLVMLESGSDHVLYDCASNGGRFLDALIIVADFLERRVVDDKLFADIDLNIKVGEECGDIAGGDVYADFYKMLFGV